MVETVALGSREIFVIDGRSDVHRRRTDDADMSNKANPVQRRLESTRRLRRA